jgi:3-phenylpropionate/trans-cinnamate dioxygenase ferredoxin component
MRVGTAEQAKAAILTKSTINRVPIVFGMIGERAFAFDSYCPHKGGPLDRGELIGKRIKCPWHGYEFDVFTGSVALVPYPPKYGRWRETGELHVYRTKVSAGSLYVDCETRLPTCV